MIYGLECQKVSENVLNIIKKEDYNIIREVFKIKYEFHNHRRVSVKKIMIQNDIIPIGIEIERRRMNFMGRVIENDEGNLSKWILEGKLIRNDKENISVIEKKEKVKKTL